MPSVNKVNYKGTEYDIVGEELANKAEIDGYYEQMSVGNAEQLIATVYEEDSAPYNFRTSGGTIDIGDRETDMLVGGSVVWNQLAPNNLVSSTAPATIAFPKGTQIVAGHKYLCTAERDSSPSANTENFGLYTREDGVNESVSAFRFESGQLKSSRIITKKVSGVSTGTTTNANGNVWLYRSAYDSPSTVSKFQIYDLTQMFGSTIADYIYNLEQANAGAGVAWFRKLFPKPYYEYNAGELMSVKAVSHDMVGFNALDPENLTQRGGNNVQLKNRINVVCGQTYELRWDSGFVFNGVYIDEYDASGERIKSNGVYSNTLTSNKVTLQQNTVSVDLNFYRSVGITPAEVLAVNPCLHLVWDGERDGEYEEYEKHSYPLDENLELRGIPKLDANNNLYYDGDTYESDGTVTRRYGINVLDGNGTYSLNGVGAETSNVFYYPSPAKAYGRSNFVSDKFTTNGTGVGGADGRDANNGIEFRLPASVAQDTNAIKAWFAANPTTLIYELATPTEETAEPFVNPQIVDDFGTEEYVDTRDVAIPVGHVTQYQPNLRAKLEMAPESPDGDGDYIVRQTNGTNEYVRYTGAGQIANLETAQASANDKIAALQEFVGYVEETIPGVQIDFENNTFTRLGAAVGLTAGHDFDQFEAFGGRRRCNLADDGTVNAYYGDAGYVEDGSNGQVMVEQPRFYYKVQPLKLKKQAVGTGFDILKANYYISDTPREGFKLHPAFVNEDGVEVDRIYIGASEACLYDVSEGAYNVSDAQNMALSEDLLSSVFGVKPASGLTQQFTRPNIETMAKNRGKGWHSLTAKSAMATFLLMFVEGAGNLQTVYGSGVNGITDNSAYNCASITGSTSSLGNASGRATSTVNEINGVETTYTEANRTAVSYRGEESPYGNIWKFVYGMNIWGDGTMQGGEVYIAKDFNFAESKRDGNYEGCGWLLPNANGYVKYLGYGNPDYDWLLVPSSVGGTSALPIGDYLYITANLNAFRVASLGGSWSNGANCGLCWTLSAGVGSRDRAVGGRLVFFPYW